MELELSHTEFYDKMKASVDGAYSVALQITFDEHLFIECDPGVTFKQTMANAIDDLRKTLFFVWPRAKDIRYATIQLIRRSTLTHWPASRLLRKP